MRFAFIGSASLIAMLAAGAGHAEDNEAISDQDGAGNAALIAQDGTGNSGVLTQEGDDNGSDIIQQGDGNRATTAQTGNDNSAEVLQTADPVFNDGAEDNSADSSLRGNANKTAITQFNSDNGAEEDVVGNRNVLETSQAGNGNASTLGVTGNRNEVDIDQLAIIGSNASSVSIDGNASRGEDNSVIVRQIGANASDVEITGDRSVVGISQEGLNLSSVDIGGMPEGDDNRVGIIQDGANNGIVDIFGDDNTVNLEQGFESVFALNNAEITIDGAFNEGVANDIDVRQRGGNDATVAVSGDRNGVSVEQEGKNTATLTIAGDSEGDDNRISIAQDYDGRLFGRRNTITATVHGDRNNTGSFTGADAIAAAGSLSPGDLFQSGRGNSITLEVGSETLESDDNAFAFLQRGRGNTIRGSIGGGNANQVAVVQNGTGNMTDFAQIGSFNVLGVSQ